MPRGAPRRMNTWGRDEHRCQTRGRRSPPRRQMRILESQSLLPSYSCMIIFLSESWYHDRCPRGSSASLICNEAYGEQHDPPSRFVCDLSTCAAHGDTARQRLLPVSAGADGSLLSEISAPTRAAVPWLPATRHRGRQGRSASRDSQRRARQAVARLGVCVSVCDRWPISHGSADTLFAKSKERDQMSWTAG